MEKGVIKVSRLICGQDFTGECKAVTGLATFIIFNALNGTSPKGSFNGIGVEMTGVKGVKVGRIIIRFC